MKIASQPASNSVSDMKVTSGPTQTSVADFKSTFSSAVASSTERSDKAAQAQESKSGPESNKRKETPTQSATGSHYAAAPHASEAVTSAASGQSLLASATAAYPGTSAVPVPQFVVPAIDQTATAVATTTDLKSAQLPASRAVVAGGVPATLSTKAENTTPAVTDLNTGVASAPQNGAQVANSPVTPAQSVAEETKTTQPPTSESEGASSGQTTQAVPVSTDLDAAVATTTPQIVAPITSGQGVLPTGLSTATGGVNAGDPSSILSSQTSAATSSPIATSSERSGAGVSRKLPADGVTADKAVSQTAKTAGSSATSTLVSASGLVPEATTVKQMSPDLSGKAFHVEPHGSDSVRAQSEDKAGAAAATTTATTTTTAAPTAGMVAQANGSTDAAAQGQGAGQPNGAISAAALPVTVPTVDLQDFASGNSFSAQSGISGLVPAVGASTNGQVVSSTGSSSKDSIKGKDGSPDVREKRGNDVGDDSESANIAANAPVVVKVSETSANANHASNSPAGSANTDVAQVASVASPATLSNHEQPSAQPAGTSLPTATHTQGAGAGSATDLQNASPVNSAQLIQSMHHSEMRLGMQSGEFGDISISTSINRQALSAQILIEHSELGKALAVHLPAIEAKLGSAYGVEARVEVRDGSAASSYSNPGQQSKERSQSQGGSAQLSGGIAARTSVRNESTTASIAAGTSRLDIRI